MAIELTKKLKTFVEAARKRQAALSAVIGPQAREKGSTGKG